MTDNSPRTPNVAYPYLEAPSPKQPEVQLWEWLALGGIVLIGLAFRFYGPELSVFTLHTARDMYRSLLLLRLEEIPLLGSEMQYGGRVFGPLMYFICAPVLAISESPVSIFYLIAIFNTALLIIMWRILRGIFGCWIAIITIAIYAVFPLEIGQLRFIWNPCFLPFMLTVALGALWRVTVFGEKWWLVICVMFLCFALQLHFSSMQAIIIAAIIITLAKPRVDLPVIAVSLLVIGVLFTPFVLNELTTETSNIAEVVDADFSERGQVERFNFNPQGIRNFFYHVHLDFKEENHNLGFSVLESVELIGPIWIGEKKMLLANIINYFGIIQLVFWVIGFLYCLGKVFEYYTDDDITEEFRDSNRCQMIPYLTLVLLQVVPVLVLSFFNFHGKPGDPPSLAPIRYYLVCYPAPFITTAIGVVMMSGWARHYFNSKFGQHLVMLLFGGLFLSHIVFNILYLQVIERSGRFQPYSLPNVTPNTGTMLWFREELLDTFEIDRDAYYERVHAQNVAVRHFGEATLDYLITQDKRSLRNEAPDENLRWLLFAPIVGHTGYPDQWEPAIPGNAEETRRVIYEDKGFTILEYRVADPDQSIAPDQQGMRNYYFQDIRMRYLGPEKYLRDQTSLVE